MIRYTVVRKQKNGKCVLDHQGEEISLFKTAREAREDAVSGLVFDGETPEAVWKRFHDVGWRIGKVKVDIIVLNEDTTS